MDFRAAGDESGPGWREITAQGDRTTLAESDVPEASLSARLTRYPEAELASPPDARTASLRVRPGGPALAAGGTDEADAPASALLPRGADRWTRALDDLVARHDLTVGFAALALLLAVFLGAMHALAPGHGKTLMAATAAARGGRARMRDVLPMAASVTVTHTLGVLALGLLVTAGSAAAPSVVAWLGIASGVLVTLAGAQLVRRALRQRGRPTHPHPHEHEHTPDHGHERPHDHPHPHDHDHPHPHDLTHTHTHGGRTHTHTAAPSAARHGPAGVRGRSGAQSVRRGGAGRGRRPGARLVRAAAGRRVRRGPGAHPHRRRVRGGEGGRGRVAAARPAPALDERAVGGAGAPERASRVGVRGAGPGGRIGVQGAASALG